MSVPSYTRPESQLGFTFEAPRQPERRTWTVNELVSNVRTLIEREYASLWVEGEISNLRAAPSGHFYFTLKDEASQLGAVIFRRQASLLRFKPENGMSVLVRGRVSVYDERGQLQLIAEFIEPAGAGSLQVAFEQLKAKLQQEGLFESSRKKALPSFPRCVGIVTSPAGAVIRDFVNIVTRRHSAAQILLYPALVQGPAAAAEVCAGIDFFNKSRLVDLIVIARGGGSLEDLAPFNSELLARTIAKSELPIVSAIGHETDFTIADFVADLRAPTPSAAAELITETHHKIEEYTNDLAQRLDRACRYRLMQAHQQLTRLQIESSLTRIHGLFSRRQQHLDALTYRIESAASAHLRSDRDRLHASSSRLLRHDATHRLHLLQEKRSTLDTGLLRTMSLLVDRHRFTLRNLEARLNSLSPLAVLDRGYAVVFGQDGAAIRDANQTTEGQVLSTRLARGSFQSRVLSRS